MGAGGQPVVFEDPGNSTMENQTAPPGVHPAGQQNGYDAPADGDTSHPSCESDNDLYSTTDGKGSGIEQFVSHFTDEIASRYDRVKQEDFPEDTTAAFRDFLAGCGQEAKALAESDKATDSRQRERLLDLLLRIGDANQRLRRSARAKSAFPVWLRREDPGRTWEEETWTSTVSRYGAGFVCKHAVDVGGRVVLCRRDKGTRSEARVVYAQLDAEGRRQIGVEILDQEDFWGLNRNTPA
jgi:hypothetical protein